MKVVSYSDSSHDYCYHMDLRPSTNVLKLHHVFGDHFCMIYCLWRSYRWKGSLQEKLHKIINQQAVNVSLVFPVLMKQRLNADGGGEGKNNDLKVQDVSLRALLLLLDFIVLSLSKLN